MQKSLNIEKVKGEVLRPADVHGWLDRALSLCSNGKWVLKLERKKEPRSIGQNALMWMWFECISEETGQDRQTVHDYYCTQYLVRNTEFNGKPVRVVMGTSGLDRETMTWFLDRVQADAASELGIVLPTPDDMRFGDFCEHYKGRI